MRHKDLNTPSTLTIVGLALVISSTVRLGVLRATPTPMPALILAAALYALQIALTVTFGIRESPASQLVSTCVSLLLTVSLLFVIA